MSDCVSREAVLNTLDTMDKVLDENRTIEAYKELLKECYKELPPVTSTIPTCGDAISREEAIEAFRNCILPKFKDDEPIMALIGIEKIIYELPPVTSERPKWIPVSERLPRKDGYYLATVHINGKTYVHMTQNLDVPDEGVVTAWMPLPEPYKEED